MPERNIFNFGVEMTGPNHPNRLETTVTVTKMQKGHIKPVFRNGISRLSSALIRLFRTDVPHIHVRIGSPSAPNVLLRNTTWYFSCAAASVCSCSDPTEKAFKIQWQRMPLTQDSVRDSHTPKYMHPIQSHTAILHFIAGFPITVHGPTIYIHITSSRAP